MKKEVTFKWGPEEEESFKDLRQALCETPILQYPDYEQSFTITTDASGYAVGAVLSQEKDGIDLPIAFFSHVLNSAECNYSTTEKECLAVLYAVHQFRPYVYGKEFVLVSDHEPLRWIDSVKDPGPPEDLNITYTLKPQDSDKNIPNLKTHRLKEPESETSENSSDEEIEKDTVRLLPIQTRQSKKTEEAKTKTPKTPKDQKLDHQSSLKNQNIPVLNLPYQEHK